MQYDMELEFTEVLESGLVNHNAYQIWCEYFMGDTRNVTIHQGFSQKSIKCDDFVCI